jgi:hypothetical protein
MKSNGANGPAGTTPAGTFLSCPGKEICGDEYIGRERKGWLINWFLKYRNGQSMI